MSNFGKKVVPYLTYLGLRPGEKLYEEKLMAEEGLKKTPNDLIHIGYKEMGWDIKDFPNAYAYYENLITLPLHTKLSDEDVEYVIENYKEVVREYIS